MRNKPTASDLPTTGIRRSPCFSLPEIIVFAIEKIVTGRETIVSVIEKIVTGMETIVSVIEKIVSGTEAIFFRDRGGLLDHGDNLPR